MWRYVLTELVNSGRYGTQGDLVGALRDRGHDVNQSSVSRELKRQRVGKVRGRYVAMAAAGLPDSIELLDARASVGGPMVVLRTHSAGAPMLASVLDGARIPGVLGTLAGDDTVFVACSSFDGLGALETFLGRRLDGAYGDVP
jgi:transcriptional regulator of arginine metabolism